MSDTLTDRFGRVFVITIANGNATYVAEDGSLSLRYPAEHSREGALDTINSMAPAEAPEPPAAPIVPDVVSNFQARAVLLQIPGATPGSTLLDDVNAWVTAQGGLAYQAWEYGIEVRRDSALIAAAGVQFGLSEAQLDQLFITAATITV